MRYTAFTSYDIVLLAQGLSVSLALFLATTIIGLFIGSLWAVIPFPCWRRLWLSSRKC